MRRVFARTSALGVRDARVGYILLAAFLAFVPLVLATLAFGRAFRASETNGVDSRLTAEVRAAVDAVAAAAATAEREARSLAESRSTQVALLRHEPVVPRDPHPWLRLSAVVPGAATPPPAPSTLTRTLTVVSGGAEIGVVRAQVSLPVLVERFATATGTRLGLVVDGRSVAGGVRGPVDGLAAGVPTSARAGGERYRALAAPVAPRASVVAVVPSHAIEATVRRRQTTTIAAGALTIAALALTALLLLSRRAAPGSARDHRRHRSPVALVGDVAASAHDPRALLPVLLETAVVATSAAGGHVTWDGDRIAAIGSQLGVRSLRLPLDDGEAGASGAREIVLYARRGDFSTADENVARSLVAQGRIALENAHLHSVVRRQAVTDELTDLPNRRRFMEEIRLAVARAARLESPLALVLFDLDHFKQINDRFGHQVGDVVLRSTAAVIRGRVRETDVPARIGGEEFAVLLPGTDLAGGRALAEHLRRDLPRLVRVPGSDWHVTASFGVADLGEHDSADTLIAAADRALYRAKAEGRDVVCLAAHEGTSAI